MSLLINFFKKLIMENKTVSFDIFLEPEFPVNSLILIQEALRISNQYRINEIFKIKLITTDGKRIRSSNGQWWKVDAGLEGIKNPDFIVVLGGNLPVQKKSKKLFSILRVAHKNLSKIIAIDTGAFLLAEAGLITNDTVVCVHWEVKNNFLEKYSNIKIVDDIYTINRNGLIFGAGGISTLDLILECISTVKGKDYANEIAQALIYRPRENSTNQKDELFELSLDNICKKAIQIMEKNIEVPLKINEISKKLNVSLRTLERKFYKMYKISPIKFYVNLRVKFARNLLFYDDRKINEISSMAGFNYNSVFINSFKKIYNKTPSEYRKYFRNQQFDNSIF